MSVRGGPSEAREDKRGCDLARLRVSRGGFFCATEGVQLMANHLTPDELSKELHLDRQEVIRVCVEEGVPIYHGKIDKYLFQAQLQAIRATQPGLEDFGARRSCAPAPCATGSRPSSRLSRSPSPSRSSVGPARPRRSGAAPPSG